MISVSTAWKSAIGCYNIPFRNTLAPLSDIRIDYEQIDESAQLSADASVSGETAWSDSENVHDRLLAHDTCYATLEPNLWLLDGEFTNSPVGEFGWVSDEISGSDGAFSSAPFIAFSWDEEQEMAIPGLTITWSAAHDEWAKEFTITAYSGNAMLSTATFVGTKAEEQYTFPVSGYDSIKVTVNKWCLPYRRARMDTAVFGSVVRITRAELSGARLSMTEDPLSLTLPKDELTFTIDNSTSEWNPDNPSGRYASLSERQTVIAYMAYKVNGAMEWHKLRTCFLSEWNTPQNGITATFTARSVIEFMDSRFSPGDITGYTFGDSITLKDLMEEAFEQADIPTNPDGSAKWHVDASLADTVVIPYEEDYEGNNEWKFDYTCAEVVQLSANAARAIIHVDETGDVYVRPQDDTVTDYYVDPYVSYSTGEYTLSSPIKDVLVNNGTAYIPTGASVRGATQQINNSLIQGSSASNAVAEWIGSLLAKRRSITSSYRMDPRLQAGDILTNKNKYAVNTVRVTEVNINYSGAYKGTYSGRVLKSIPIESMYGNVYSGEISANGEW